MRTLTPHSYPLDSLFPIGRRYHKMPNVWMVIASEGGTVTVRHSFGQAKQIGIGGAEFGDRQCLTARKASLDQYRHNAALRADDVLGCCTPPQ